jgi:hypothetical protein
MPAPMLKKCVCRLHSDARKLGNLARRITGDGWTAVIDSLDQGVNDIPVTAIALKGDELTFENKGIAAKFVGKVDHKKG